MGDNTNTSGLQSSGHPVSPPSKYSYQKNDHSSLSARSFVLSEILVHFSSNLWKEHPHLTLGVLKRVYFICSIKLSSSLKQDLQEGWSYLILGGVKAINNDYAHQLIQ